MAVKHMKDDVHEHLHLTLVRTTQLETVSGKKVNNYCTSVATRFKSEIKTCVKKKKKSLIRQRYETQYETYRTIL